MHKIDSPGATVGNLFTEGNPSLSIPATEVSDDWLNDVQTELVTVIEGQGITLLKGDGTQLNAALLSMLGAGGQAYKLDPVANSTASQDIPSLVFDSADFKGAIIFFDIHRETASANKQESGIIVLNRDTADSVWRIEKLISGLDNAGVTWAVTAGGQVRVSTDDLAGASYSGEVRVTGVIRFAN